MPKFQVGQKVRCVDASNSPFIEGLIYKVNRWEPSDTDEGTGIDGFSFVWRDARFVAIDEPTETVDASSAPTTLTETFYDDFEGRIVPANDPNSREYTPGEGTVDTALRANPETWTEDKPSDLQLAYDGARRACVEKEETIEALRFDIINLNKTIADKDMQIVELNRIQRIAADKIVALESTTVLSEQINELMGTITKKNQELTEEKRQRKNFENAADQLAHDLKNALDRCERLELDRNDYARLLAEERTAKQAIVDAAEIKQTELETKVDILQTAINGANQAIGYRNQLLKQYARFDKLIDLIPEKG